MRLDLRKTFEGAQAVGIEVRIVLADLINLARKT
jgi:hypothetical protein